MLCEKGQEVQWEIAAVSPESKGWAFLTLEGEQSMQTFWKKTCRELYRRTTLTEAQTRETTDQVKWESLKVNESKMAEQELDDEDRQARFWRRRPDGFTVNEKGHIIYVLEFK